MTNVMEGGGHLERHQQEELVGVSEEEGQYFISCSCFSALIPIAFFPWHFFVSLFTAPFPCQQQKRMGLWCLWCGRSQLRV